MDDRKFVFVGNREFVLNKMIDNKLNIVGIFVMEHSHLANRLQKTKHVDFSIISSKKQLLDALNILEYDVLVSNGCKYILPISKMKKAIYINVHPSYLPDLKGLDPINGACLFGREAGASCHLIDDGVDTGNIISRVPIALTEDIDATLLFQLCFRAESAVFQAAYNANFIPLQPQPQHVSPIYYSLTEKDLILDTTHGADFIVKQAKAFGYASKGLYFKCGNRTYKAYSAEKITNPFAHIISSEIRNNEVFITFDNSLLFKMGDDVIRLNQIDKRNGDYCEGEIITMCTIDDIHDFEKCE